MHRVIEKYVKGVSTQKNLVVSLWTCFEISQQPRWIRKNRNHQKFLLMQGYLSWKTFLLMQRYLT